MTHSALSNASLLKGLIITGTLLAGSAALAAPATAGEKRGYYNCVKSAASEARGFYTAGSYYINKTDDARSFYINAGAWIGDKREPVRVSCDTSLSGNRVLSVNVAPGRFAPATNVETFEVASK
ncbi:MAG: hypothetical protein NXH85_00365 [Pseudomonadaceae bacterium]|nr:hypothetical protein [Pseudomonadaceae bacterium]